MTDAIAVADLSEALNRLREHGWTRGSMHDIPTGRCCAVGAFGWPWPTDSPGITYLADQARNEPGWEPPPVSDLAVVIRYNDYPKRTFEQVEALFERAIKTASGQPEYAACTITEKVDENPSVSNHNGVSYTV